MPLARLEKWLGSVGISIEAEKVRIRASNGALGVFAVSDVTKSDLLCTIPKAAVLSVKNSGIADLLEENRIRGASFCRCFRCILPSEMSCKQQTPPKYQLEYSDVCPFTGSHNMLMHTLQAALASSSPYCMRWASRQPPHGRPYSSKVSVPV